jgi:hypothetical protein
MSSPTSRARTTLRQRFHVELGLLRERGFDDPLDRVHQLRGLLRIARSVSKRQTDAEKLADLIERAASRLGRVYGPTVLTLFGLTDTAQGLKVAARRDLAYDVFCAAEQALSSHAKPPIVSSTFRTRRVKAILDDLITELFAIARGE